MSAVSAANLHQPPASVEEILARLFRPMGNKFGKLLR